MPGYLASNPGRQISGSHILEMRLDITRGNHTRPSKERRANEAWLDAILKSYPLEDLL